MRTSIMHDVPLIGPGLVRPTSKVYGIGEYKDLVNAEIITPENVVRGRRTVRKLNVDAGVYAAGATGLLRKGRFIGAHNEKAVISNKTLTNTENHSMALVDEKTWTPLWNLAAGTNNYLIKGYVVYQNTSYWILLNTTTNTVEIRHGPSVTTAIGSLTTVVTPLTNVTDIKAVFMYKHRLFIVTDNYMAYSVTTFPADFTDAVGKGGRINVTESTITYAFPYRDIVFVMTPTSIFSYTYTTDPILDGSFSKITSEIGAYYGTIYQSIPYIVGPMGLYSILNNYVEKVVDIAVEEVDVSAVNRQYKLVAWDDSIFIIKQGLDAAVPDKDYVLVYNARSRSLSRLKYRDRHQTITASGGFIQDAINIQAAVGRNEDTLLLATNTLTGHNATNVYFMQANRNSVANQKPFDDYYNNTGTLLTNPINSIVELANIAPDGLEWVMKKFRHLFFEGKIPPDSTGLMQAGFSESPAYSRSQSYVEAPFIEDKQYPRPYRMGLMQRGNALFVQISCPTVVNATAVGNFELSSLKVLWTQTARALHEKIGDGTPA